MRQVFHRREQGIALIWAILVMILVFGTIAVAATMTMTRADETRDNANRTRSALWAQAASDDIVQRLQDVSIGSVVANPTAADGTDQVWAVPTPTSGPAGGMSTFPNGGNSNAWPLNFTSGTGQTFRGWYQVLAQPGASGAWQVVYHRNPATPELQGSVEALVRVWEDGRRARPVVARMTFRRASFSRFSLLSDDRINLGGVGNLTPGGFIHTNNATNQSPAIKVEAGASLANVVKVTSTRGAIQSTGACGGGKCVAGVGDIVEFGAASRAFDRVRQLATTGRNVAQYVAGPLVGGTTMPVWWADIGNAGCADGVLYGRATFPLRQDTVGVPVLDDNQAPTYGGAVGCLPIAQGGGAVLFNGDVIVTGSRSSFRPVTIMAQRVGTLTVQQDTDGNFATLETTRVTAPASIYLDQRGVGRIGSTSSYRPVGLVAEGGVYLPSWAMRPGGANDVMNVQNVAAMAMGSEVAYGPSIISIAAEAGDVGLGLQPSAARTLGYGYGTQLNWTGSIASRRQVSFRYGVGGACGANYVGYCSRNVTYAPDLMWNPPPGYPTDRDWHMADYREFR